MVLRPPCPWRTELRFLKGRPFRIANSVYSQESFVFVHELGRHVQGQYGPGGHHGKRREDVFRVGAREFEIARNLFGVDSME